MLRTREIVVVRNKVSSLCAYVARNFAVCSQHEHNVYATNIRVCTVFPDLHATYTL